MTSVIFYYWCKIINGIYSNFYIKQWNISSSASQVLQDAKVKVTASSYIPGQAFPTEKSELEGI